MMRRFFELRFLAGMKQREIGDLLGIGQNAVSQRERRILERFAAAGLEEPIPPGRRLVNVQIVGIG